MGFSQALRGGNIPGVYTSLHVMNKMTFLSMSNLDEGQEGWN